MTVDYNVMSYYFKVQIIFPLGSSGEIGNKQGHAARITWI